MKTLKTLIKLNKKKLDNIVVEINLVEKEKATLVNRRSLLIQEAETEASKYTTSQYAYMLDQYLQASRKKQDRIQTQIHRLEPIIVRLEEELSQQFAELKKFEIALQTKQKKELEKNKKMETKFLDEFNTNKFIFNKKNS